jgi:hypothetical protein
LLSWQGAKRYDFSAENCACIFGIPAGQEPKWLGGHGWPRESAIHGGQIRAGRESITIFQIRAGREGITMFQILAGREGITMFQILAGRESITIFQIRAGRESALRRRRSR